MGCTCTKKKNVDIPKNVNATTTDKEQQLQAENIQNPNEIIVDNGFSANINGIESQIDPNLKVSINTNNPNGQIIQQKSINLENMSESNIGQNGKSMQLNDPLEISIKKKIDKSTRDKLNKPNNFNKQEHKKLLDNTNKQIDRLVDLAGNLAKNLINNEDKENDKLSKEIKELTAIKKDLDNISINLKDYGVEDDNEILDNINQISITVKKVNQFYDSYKRGLKNYKDFRILACDLLERSGIQIPEKQEKEDNFDFNFTKENNEDDKFESNTKKMENFTQWETNNKSEKNQNNEKKKKNKDNDTNFEFDFGNPKQALVQNDGFNPNDAFNNFGNDQKVNNVNHDHNIVNKGFFNTYQSQYNDILPEMKMLANPEKFTRDVQIIKLNKLERFDPAQQVANNNYLSNINAGKYDKLEKLRLIKERDLIRFELNNIARHYNRGVEEYKVLKRRHADVNKEHELIKNEFIKLKSELNKYEYQNNTLAIDNNTLTRTIDNLSMTEDTYQEKNNRIKDEISKAFSRADDRKLEAFRLDQDPKIRGLQTRIKEVQENVNKLQGIYRSVSEKYQNTTNEATKGKLEKLKKETNQVVEDAKLENIAAKDQNSNLKNSVSSFRLEKSTLANGQDLDVSSFHLQFPPSIANNDIKSLILSPHNPIDSDVYRNKVKRELMSSHSQKNLLKDSTIQKDYLQNQYNNVNEMKFRDLNGSNRRSSDHILGRYASNENFRQLRERSPDLYKIGLEGRMEMPNTNIPYNVRSSHALISNSYTLYPRLREDNPISRNENIIPDGLLSNRASNFNLSNESLRNNNISSSALSNGVYKQINEINLNRLSYDFQENRSGRILSSTNLINNDYELKKSKFLDYGNKNGKYNYGGDLTKQYFSDLQTSLLV